MARRIRANERSQKREERKEKRQERKENRQERRDKIKDKIKGVVKKVGYARLLVFKPVLVAALKKKGARVSMSTKMEELVPMFKDVVIDKKAVLNYEDYDCLEHVVPPQAVEGIVQVVLEFIKQLKAKKEKGEKLTEEEQAVLDGAEVEADKEMKGENASTDKNWLKDFWYIWVALAVLLVYFVVKKKK
jgi:hypothetical protein